MKNVVFWDVTPCGLHVKVIMYPLNYIGYTTRITSEVNALSRVFIKLSKYYFSNELLPRAKRALLT
jgi:hypothetical protein